MAHTQVLSPTHQDNDVLILEGVLAGVAAQGAQYGLSHPRRDHLRFTLETLIRSMREGWEDQLMGALLLLSLQAGRPSQPGDGHGDTHLSDPTPGLTG
jgi:hypothetical protein